MLSDNTIQIVKATAPAVAAHAEEITRRFYTLMFTGDPQVQAFFNQAHQHSGGQQRALAGAICAYAANIDNLGALGSAVELIAQKHCSLGIQPEHYPIVGKHLLVAVKDILGDAATDEVIAAWAEAYGFLANIFIEREAAIYAEQAAVPGGWSGYRSFVVDRKVKESDLITSFYLKPKDGGPVPAHKPGQYITVKVEHPTTPTSPRNYSLSDRAGAGHLRISVKRECSPVNGCPPGLISNYLHDQVNVGDVLELRAPSGEFTLDVRQQRPVVLLSAGVGITPLLSMLKTLAAEEWSAPVHFFHFAQNSRIHAFTDEVREASAGRENFFVHYRYDKPLQDDLTSGRCNSIGMLDRELLEQVNRADADYYFCGPKPFMTMVRSILLELGIGEDRMHYEFFGPKEVLAMPAGDSSLQRVA